MLSSFNKKLSYRRVTARCVLSVVILPTATPTCVQNLKSLALAVVEILHGVQNSKAGYLTLTTPLSGKIFLRLGGTCYDKLMYQIRSL